MADGSAGCKVMARLQNRELENAEMLTIFYSTIHDGRLYMLIYDAKAGVFSKRAGRALRRS